MINADPDELANATRVLLTQVRPVKRGDLVLITADSQADQVTARAVAEQATELGAIPTVMTYPTGTVTGEPPAAVAQAGIQSDHWINLSVGYHLYSAAYARALEADGVYLELTGMDADMMIRTIGRVDNELLIEVRDLLYRKSQAADTLRLTSPAGSDLTMTVDKAGDPFWESVPGDTGFGQMLGGQSGCMIIRESVNGTMVFDGAAWPPDSVGLVSTPIVMTVTDGYLTSFEGGDDAAEYERWLREAGHREALIFDHLCYGFNPGVQRPSGKILEDERVFGCVQVGVGAPAYESPVHSDGVILNPSVWLDDVQLQSDGTYVDPEIAPLADRLLEQYRR